MAEPSKVIHMRSVPFDATEADLQQLAASFGPISRCVILRSKNQAMIQMADIPTAIQIIQYYNTTQAQIRGRPVYLQFSSHQELSVSEQQAAATNVNPEGLSQEQQPNRILLITIHNPLYPITVDVLNQVFSAHGRVEKIVIFNKPAGLQALLQYAAQPSAINAVNLLQGRNIYDGCCTLDIQFSNLNDLHVNMNSERSRDYTNATLPEQRGPGQGGNAQGSIFGDGGLGIQGQGPRQGGFQPGGVGMNMGFPMGMNSAAQLGVQLPQGISGANDRKVLLASGFDVEKMDHDKLFNLISNYGNVARIKILQNKPDHALVEMQEGFQAEMAVTYLKGVVLFGKKLDVTYSKHASITVTADCHDYSGSSMQRFSRSASKNYRHCSSPTSMLHCSNLAPSVTAETVTAYLSPHGTVKGSKLIESAGKKQVLVQFESEEQALEALVSKHGTNFEGQTIRLAFSKSQI